MQLWTIGHSTLPIDEFLERLGAYRIAALADVRRFPGSRKHPHFGQQQLAEALAERRIAYEWFEALGGRRSAAKDSPNTAWRNAAFRGYADYMATPAFQQALQRLIELASNRRTAIMCAEAVWWRCHRSLVSDTLTVLGFEVIHIADATHAATHPMTAPARVVDGKLTYATAPDSLF